MKQCEHCPNPVEADRYDMCKDCWWDRDPRNIKNGGTVQLKDKTSIVSGLLLIMDSEPDIQGDIFSPECRVELRKNIPIIIDALEGGKLNNILGHAEVRQFGNVLVYEGQIFDKKQVPKGVQHVLYPCACGKILEKKDGVINKFMITDIMIASSNADKRIPHLRISEDQK